MHRWVIWLVCLLTRAGEDLPVGFDDRNVTAIRFQLLVDEEVEERLVLVRDSGGCTERFAGNTSWFRRRGRNREDEWVRRVRSILSVSWRYNV